jgi:hypothetical protein
VVQIPLMEGENSDIGVRWYTSVGASILLTMILNIFVPHFGVWAQYPIRRIKVGSQLLLFATNLTLAQPCRFFFSSFAQDMA